MNDRDALNIYTDGSAQQHPRRGGVGIRFVFPESFATPEKDYIKDIKLAGYKNATNNQMELKACILGLQEAIKLPEFNGLQKIVVHTDSKYVVDGHKYARHTWLKNKWLTQSGAPVLNTPIWKELLKVVSKIHKTVEIRWVQGHHTSQDNKAVDRLAKLSAQRPIGNIGPPTIIRRKTTSGKTEKGSVQMLGQCMTIKIVTSQYLAEHAIFRLRYEVLSKTSIFNKKIDFIFSKNSLRAGHIFYVRLNKNQRYPQIEKVIREVKK